MSRPSTLALLLALPMVCGVRLAAPERVPEPRYVIFLMADGMGADELELGRQYSLAVLGHELFLTGSMARQGYCALVDTYSSDSAVTDSAAGASAWATGHKIKNGQLSVDPATGEPLPTILEYYKARQGFRTGIVTDDEVTGASPAAFASHVKARILAQDIARQYCDQSQPDVILGGGRRAFLPADRRDGRNLVEEFVSRLGYRYVETADELARVRSGKVLGLFATGTLTWGIDRPLEGSTEPMPTEMTEAALRILSAGRPRGFFLFVEEAMPDKAGHRNDAAATVRGVLEFDRAVAAACRFYRAHPRDTLVLATADHETGGLQWMLGYEWEHQLRAGARREGERSPVARLASVNTSIGKVVAGLQEQLTPEERARLRWRYRDFQFDARMDEAFEQGRRALGRLGDKWDNVLSFLVAQNTGAYYTTTGHSIAPVPLFSIGVGAERLSGHLDNTDIGRTLFRLAGRQDFRPAPTSAPLAAARPRLSPTTSSRREEESAARIDYTYGEEAAKKLPARKSSAGSKGKGRTSGQSDSSAAEDN